MEVKEIKEENILGNNEKGATMVEYALLVAIMAVGCIASVRFMRISVGEVFLDTGFSLIGT